MTEGESIEKNHETDKIKREEIIATALNIPFENNPCIEKPTSVFDAHKFYSEHFSEYGKYCILPYKKYVMAEFWLNDEGFQFKWRNHKMIIQLECLSWDEVYKRLKTR